MSGAYASDIHGYYRLLTDFIPSTWEFYCIKILSLPGMNQVNPTILSSSAFYYQSTSGMVYYAGVELRDIVVTPAATLMAPAQAAPQTADTSIQWQAFRDDNGNGIRDGVEPPLPGAKLSAGTTESTSTADGWGSLTGLDQGLYTLAIAPPDGYLPVGDSSRGVWIGDIDLQLGQIGFRPAGWLIGSLFVDEDGDGLRAADEPGLGGVSLTLTGPQTVNLVSAPDGSLASEALPDGLYSLSMSLPAGFASPPAQTVNLQNGGNLSVGLQSAEHVTGAVYEDWDGDGMRLPDEPLLAHNILVDLGGDMQFLQAGKFLFWDAGSGSYTLTPQYAAASSVSVSLPDGGSAALGSVPNGVLRGSLWIDSNADGIRQPWEAPLVGVSVSLDGVILTTTDSFGHYLFVNVAAGSHTLSAQLPAGLTANDRVVNTLLGRGAAVGIPASIEETSSIFLPLINR